MTRQTWFSVGSIVCSITYTVMLFFRDDIWQFAYAISNPPSLLLTQVHNLMFLTATTLVIISSFVLFTNRRKNLVDWLVLAIPIIILFISQLLFVELITAREFNRFSANADQLNNISGVAQSARCDFGMTCNREIIDLREYDLSNNIDSAFVDFDHEQNSVLGIHSRGLLYYFWFEHPPETSTLNMGQYVIDCFRSLDNNWFICRMWGT